MCPCRKVKGEDGLPLAASDDEEDEEAAGRERRSMLNYEEYYPVLLPLRRPEDEGPEEEPPDDEANAVADTDWAQIAVRGLSWSQDAIRAGARIACGMRTCDNRMDPDCGARDFGWPTQLPAGARPYNARHIHTKSRACYSCRAVRAASAAWRFRSCLPSCPYSPASHGMCACACAGLGN